MCAHDDYQPGCNDCRRDGDEVGAWNALTERLAAAEGEVRHLKGAVDTLTASGQEWRNRAIAAERARDEAVAALAKCVTALRRARHTRSNVMSFKDYWVRHAQPACAHAEAVYDRITARARAVLEGGAK